MDTCSMLSNSVSEPLQDMEFESHEDAYSFYKEYAKSVGFGTAKLSSRRSRSSKEFIDAKFSCIRYGNKQQSDDAINPRPSPKIGCKASMHVKRRQNGRWYVFSFVKEHNHELLPDQAHFFRSHRNEDSLKTEVRLKRRKNLTAVTKLFSAYQNVDCLEGYMRNQLDKSRSLLLEPGDAQLLLEFFMHMQEENPKFFYAFDFNEEHRLRNVFWVDPKGIEDFEYFHDVVCFDTTYFINKHKLPLVLFIGVNRHIQPTLLGSALIADDTVYTFVWLFQTWSVAMGERFPQVILTNQSNAVKAAVGAAFPESQHFLCLCDILDKIPKHLEYLSLWQDSFMVKFNKCINCSWTEAQFEKRWWKLVDKFNLREMQWMQSLYEDRKKWVPLFIKGVSLAGLSAATRSESLNSFFDKFVHPETTMREFIEQYGVMLENKCEEEAKADFDAWHETPELKSPSPFEKQMLLVYTHEIFKKFQVEVLGAAACHLKKETEEQGTAAFNVKDFVDNQNYMVEWSDILSEICCSCRSFEYKGYLCRHAIVVLQMSGIFNIPVKYVLQRWTSAALSRHPIGEKFDELQAKVRRYNDLCRRAIILGEEGSLSEDSYNVALSSIKDALKQCKNIVSSVDNDYRPTTSALYVVEDQNTSCDSRMVSATKSGGSLVAEHEAVVEEVDESCATRKGKLVLYQGAANIGAHRFLQMEQADPSAIELHDIMHAPAHLHNVAPIMFDSVSSTHFHPMAATNMHENQLPREVPESIMMIASRKRQVGWWQKS